jgi:site-specific DNA recombinase
MARHEKADHNFYVTANMVMNLAARAREIFESSEVDEKRQLLNFVFQNLKLEGKNLSIDICEPFTTLVDYKKCPKGWGNLDLNQGPAGYEGGGPPYNPILSNRYE